MRRSSNLLHTPGRLIAIAALALSVSACATTQPETILSNKGAVELRAMQSRSFETGDQSKVYRAVLATFQDLGYTISKLEPAAGTITADKLAQLRMTASVYARGENRTIVRANAVVKARPDVDQGHQVDAPEFYQQRFFEPLSKALFLTALHVDENDQPTAPQGTAEPTRESTAAAGDTPPSLPVPQPEPAASRDQQ